MFEKRKLNKLMQDAHEDDVTLDQLVITKQAHSLTEAIQILEKQEEDIIIDQIENLGHDSILGF